MRSFLSTVVAIAVSGAILTQAAEQDSRPALAWHFAGTTEIFKANPEATLSQIAGLKSSVVLANQVRSVINGRLPGWLGLDPQKFPPDVVSPLTASLPRYESAANVAGDSLTGGDWVIAVALHPENESVWKSGLMAVGRRLGFGEPQSFKLGDLEGWKLPAIAGLRSYAFVQNKAWLLVANRFDDGTLAASWAKALTDSGRPVPALKDDWLQISANLDALHLHPKLPFAGAINYFEGAMAWSDKNLRTTGKLTLASDHTPNDDAWRIPRGIIHDPLISFTAVRGLQSFIGDLAAFKGMTPDSIPDQFFNWTQGTVAFVDDFALPVSDENQMFKQLELSIPAAYNPAIMEMSLGKWLATTNHTRLLWRGLPIFVPFLGPVDDHGQGFLYGGLFPLNPKTNAPPAPQELFAQIESRKNLFYYDWEIAPARLAAFKQVHPFVNLVIPEAKPGKAAFADPWLNEIQGKLGNVITEITGTAPRELSFTRKSQIGLTGIELWVLTHWFDSETFPEFPYSKPKKPERGKVPLEAPGPSAKPVRKR